MVFGDRYCKKTHLWRKNWAPAHLFAIRRGQKREFFNIALGTRLLLSLWRIKAVLKHSKWPKYYKQHKEWKSIRDGVWPPSFYYSTKLISFQFQFIRLDSFLVVLFCLNLHSAFVFAFCRYEAKNLSQKRIKIL